MSKDFHDLKGIQCIFEKYLRRREETLDTFKDLQNCKQLRNEDVTKYSLKIECILTKIQTNIHYNYKCDKELPGRIAAMEEITIYTFMLGLDHSIYIVR